MARRAVASFEAQTYQTKKLYILNTGGILGFASDDVYENWAPRVGDYPTIGALRNECLSHGFVAPYCAHCEDDDVSSPDRLALQLAHIQKTGKLLTGFYDMAMYDAANDKTWIYLNEDHRYALGTSLFYRREAWERVKFPDKTPEDNIWRKEVGLDNCESRSCFREDGSPIMVQTVHGGNASARIFPSSHRYKRASSLQDEQIRELLK